MFDQATGVMFSSSDLEEASIFALAEHQAMRNIKNFGGKKVMVEGGGYKKVWIETQPMGGEMYAKRDLSIALNNQLIFMEHQREDGRFPGAIELLADGTLEPQYRQFQGFCFAEEALNMYYLIGEDKEYLHMLYSALRKFDNYLWSTRDSDGDGCLESWCQYDTGEDNSTRYRDAPRAWLSDTAPEGYQVVPIASMDFMGYSYVARTVLSKISKILHENDEKEFWTRKAADVLKKMQQYLWDAQRGAYFDRDKNHKILPELIHNTLRTMYWGAITPDMARQFVVSHILNTAEFWTPMPLPSIAANDPLFRNVPTNNWSGQVEALTYQRALRAFERYGYVELIPILGRKFLRAVSEKGYFVQQFDPFTGKPSLDESADIPGTYGPAILSSLEYIARMHGVSLRENNVIWGAFGHSQCKYTQFWNGNEYSIESNGVNAIARINNKCIFTMPTNMRVVTTLHGEILKKQRYIS